MRITAQLIIHCILPMDGIDGEGRIERMSPKGIKRKPSKSFSQDFPTAFYYHYQRGISIIVPSIIFVTLQYNLYITTMQHNRMNIPANTLYRSTKCFERVSYVHASSIESLNKYNYTFQRSLCILLRLQ